MSRKATLITSSLIFLILGTLLLTVSQVNASTDNTWEKTFGGAAADRAYSLVKTSDDGYALIGTTNSFGSGLISTWLVKTDSVGNIQWNQTYSGVGQSISETLIQTSDEGFAFAGYTYSMSEGAGGLYTWLAKTDYNGNLQWNQTFGQLGTAIAYSIIQTNDHGYAITGGYNTPSGGVEAYVIKTDSAGNLVWNTTYGNAGYDQLNTIIQESDGSYVLAGSTSSSSTGTSSLWLLKLDSSGNLQWNQTYAGLNSEILSNMVKTLDGGYALVGWSPVSGSSNVDFLLVKTDSSGAKQWSKTYSGLNVSQALSGIQTADQGYALAGVTNSSNTAFAKAWLVKTDSLGNAQWNQTYGGSGQNAATSIVQASDEGYVLGGFTNSTGAGAEDFWLFKTDANGIVSQMPTQTSTPNQTTGVTPSSTSSVQPQTGFASWAYVGIIVVVIAALIAVVFVLRRK
jgi:hypothetical protein